MVRLNSKKTEALWIGSCAGKSEKLRREKDFNWQNTKVKALGVWVSTGPEIIAKLASKKWKKCGTAWAVGQFED